MPPFGHDSPQWVRDTAKWLLGIEIPETSPTKLRALAETHDGLATALSEIRDLIDDTRRKARSNFSGVAADYYSDAIKKYTSGDNDYIAAATTTSQKLSDVLRKAAADAEYMSWMALVQLLMLLAEIAYAIAMAPWTGGASLTWIPAFKAIRSLLIRQIIDWFITTLLGHIAFEMLGALAGLFIQQGQIEDGKRDALDMKMARDEFLGAIITGTISAGLAPIVDRVIGIQIDRVLKNNLDILTNTPPPRITT
ncbi:WXG100-like domain-containing protein, partial [Streptomonospora wellingtoniae]